MVESLDSREVDEIGTFEGELENLQRDFFDIKKESFKAKQGLKDEIKNLGFYNGDESGENVKFNIDNIKKYLETIKNKSRSELSANSSDLEKGVWTIAIQIAINYINNKNGDISNNIDWIDGIRGNQTWKGVKQFQTSYKLKNIDGLPGRETIAKILELLGTDTTNTDMDDEGHYQNIGNIEAAQWGNDNIGVEREYFGLNHDNIDNNKCIELFRNLMVDKKGIAQDTAHKDFENMLNDRFIDEGGPESVLFKNPEVIQILNIILSHQKEDIEITKKRYEIKKKIDEGKDENKEIITLEDYKYQHSSIDNFEEFILSDEGISIIIDEIKSHIDISYDNNGQYTRFYDKNPFSIDNLEVTLKRAWENRMRSNYNKEFNDEEMENFETIAKHLTRDIDGIVSENINSDKDVFNQSIISSLDQLLTNEITDIGVSYWEFFESKEKMDAFKGILWDNIKQYERIVRKGNNINLNTGNKQTELQLKSYLYVYGRFFYSEYFKSSQSTKYYEEILPEIMKIILSNDDSSLGEEIRHKELLMAERKLEKERGKRNLARRQELARRNRERNERLQSAQKVDRQSNFGEIQTNKSFNPNQATGSEIAAKAELNLDGYEVNIEESEYRNEWRKETAFREAWKEFVQSHDKIKSIITQDQMRRIFDLNSNSIDDSQWQDFIKANPILKDIPPETIEEIYTSLSGFSSYFTEAEKRLSSKSSEMKEKVNETIKTYAIGTVIDNVRDTFSTITNKENNNSEGFQLNEISPLEMVDGDNIILSGKFNGSDIKVRYNLKTGDLFMNSFLDKLNPDKISILRNPSPNHRIGNIKNFSDLLNDCYKLPPRDDQNDIMNRPRFDYGTTKGTALEHHTKKPFTSHLEEENEDHSDNPQNPMRLPPRPPKFQQPQFDTSNIDSRREEAKNILNSQIDLIGNEIKANTESLAQKILAVMGFMKTFNVIPESGGFDSFEFNRGSNLFDIIQILDNTGDTKDGNIQALEYFNNQFMPKIMEYAGLSRGKRNEYQNKNSKKSEKIFNYDGNNENIQCLRDKTKNFEPNQFSGLANFETSHQLGFADLVKEKLITGDELNRKLDISKMESFIKDIETVDKEVDTELEKQLASID